MQNYQQPGDVITLTAPSGGVTSGLGYKIGQLFVVATNTVAETLPFEGLVSGVVELVKDAGTAWTEGELLYWDDSAKNVVDASGSVAGKMLIGCAAEAAGSSAVLGKVRLNAAARADGVSDIELEDDAVDTAAIQNDAVTAAKADIFVSAEQVATGSSQDVAHGLGGVPSAVLVIPTSHPGTPDTGAFDIAEGAHDATNIKVTMTINCAFKVFAWL